MSASTTPVMQVRHLTADHPSDGRSRLRRSGDGRFGGTGRDAETTRRRGWTWAGIGAAVASAGSILTSMAFGADLWDDPAVVADNALAAPLLAEDRAVLAGFLASGTIAALLLVVFATGLRRRLAGQSPAHSLAPNVAFAGFVLVAATMLVGTGISTELFWGLGDLDQADPDSLMSMYHLVATLSWIWAGAGLAAAAIATASLRHAALPRWIGWVSALFAVVILGFSVIPLQYMSAMVGTLWFAVVAVGLAVSRERTS